MHCSPSTANSRATMRTPRFTALDVLLPAGMRDEGEPASDASARRTVSGVALFRKPQIRGGAQPGMPAADQPQTSAAADPTNGNRSLEPQPDSQPDCTGPRDLSVPASQRNYQPPEPRLEHRYHLHSHALGIPVSGGHHGLVQALRSELGLVQHHGGRLLPLHAGDSFTRWHLRDLQLRSRLPVYFQSVSSTAERPCHLNQYGWSRTGSGQCVYRAAVALGEIRTDLPRRLRFRPRALGSLTPLLRSLQFPSS